MTIQESTPGAADRSAAARELMRRRVRSALARTTAGADGTPAPASGPRSCSTAESTSEVRPAALSA
ncbi:hypothetical protein ACWDNT_30690, partial [Streptomyces sp. NPDC000963]